MKRAVYTLLLLAPSLACEKKPTPAITVDAASPVVVASAAPVETIVVAPVDASVPPPKSPAEIAKDATPNEKAKRIGKVAAWPEADGDFSLIVIGEEKKPAHVVRRTSGEVNEVALVKMDDGDYAVAWVSSLMGGKGRVSAVAFVSADLSKASTPTTLALIGQASIEGHIAMVKSPKGGVVVAHDGTETLNSFRASAPFEVKAVSAAGKVEKLGSQSVTGGTPAELWIVDLEDRGALVYGSSMAGGREQETLLVPWTPSDPAPKFTPPVCGGLAGIRPEALRGTKGEVVALCGDARFGEKLAQCMKPVKDDPDFCLRVSVTAKDGTPITPQKDWDTPVSKVECNGPNVQLSFPGGSVTLASPSELVANWLKKKCGS